MPHGRSHLHSAVINTELNRNRTPCSHIFLCGFFFTLDSPSPTPCCVFSIFCEAVKGSEVGDGQSASCHGHTKKNRYRISFLLSRSMCLEGLLSHDGRGGSVWGESILPGCQRRGQDGHEL